MKILGHGKQTFLYLNGLEVRRRIQLEHKVELLPASCSPEPDSIIKVSQNEIDLGVVAIFLRQVRSQIRITAKDPKDLAVIAWNSMWDAVLLSAIHNCEVVCNFQCDRPAEEFGPEAQLGIVNYHFRGFTEPNRELTDVETEWIERNFATAKKLLERPEFETAVHSLAAYRWHPHPRARLAVLWSGIEGLFGIDSELVFRVSLYVARFLDRENDADMRTTFSHVKGLYKKRSAAVHGSQIKGEPGDAVDGSAALLGRLVKRCIATGELPNVEELAP